MSGWRWVGSSCGSGRKVTRASPPTTFTTSLGQLPDGELDRVAQVDRLVPALGVHQADQAVHQVVHVAEGAGLLAGAVQRQLLPAERLDDEVGDHPPVVLRHPRARRC